MTHLADLLAGMNATQLRQLILNVGAEQADFAAAIEREVNLLRRVAAGLLPANAPAAPIPVDVAAVCRTLRRDFRAAASGGGGGQRGYYYDDYDELAIDAHALLDPALTDAETLLAAGAAATATVLLLAVIEEWQECVADLEEWVLEANEESLDEALGTVDALLAESLLDQPLSTTERQQWRRRLAAWAEDVFRFSITDTALETWWDSPPLVAAMQGTITEQGAWAGEAPVCADELAQVRLRILARQGRVAEYLNLAQAEGQWVFYLAKLIELGEIQRAVTEAIANLGAPADVYAVATALVAAGHLPAALTVAAHGLDCDYPYGKEGLARWIVPLAEAQGDSALALRAAITAFLATLTLADYQAVERVAGATWPEVKRELLDQLQQTPGAFHAVDIYLYEQMLVAAMAAIDKAPYASQLARVVDATRTDYPDWGIKHCKRQAEPIMNEGKAKSYQAAADWLRTARDIYAQHHRLAEWRPYLAGLLETHARKYKLVPMLRELQ